jgi:hypothetical protein
MAEGEFLAFFDALFLERSRGADGGIEGDIVRLSPAGRALM